MKVWYDRKAKSRCFEPGDRVLVLFPVVGNPLQAKYSGPYKVVKKISETNYLIKTPGRHTETQMCHINMLKAYHEKPKPELVTLNNKLVLGRYRGIPQDERLRPICLSGEIEDELHILLHCDAYQAARDLLFLHATKLVNFNETSDLEKFRILTEHERMVRNTSKYLQHVLSTRQNLLTD